MKNKENRKKGVLVGTVLAMCLLLLAACSTANTVKQSSGQERTGKVREASSQEKTLADEILEDIANREKSSEGDATTAYQAKESDSERSRAREEAQASSDTSPVETTKPEKDEGTFFEESVQAEKETSVEESAQAEKETSVEESAQSDQETVQTVELPVYTVVACDGVKYAMTAVNVRDTPSTDGECIGRLSKNQEVVLTGRCAETGWYRIQYGSLADAYVSSSYLVDDKVEEQQVVVNVTPEEKTAISIATPEGIVAINSLENYKELKMKCTDEEFAAAYMAALDVVTPLIGESMEDQLMGIAVALRNMFDSGRVDYSTSESHYNDPYGYFVKGYASCAGCARATGLCLNMLGISYEHVNPNQWKHQWCRVNVNGTYYICDAYGLYCGPEPAPYEHPYAE